jgi:plastocyanin
LRVASVALVGCVAFAALAACGGDDDDATAKSQLASTKQADAKKPPVIQFTASGSNGAWSYQLPADGVSGGVVTLRLTNKSTQDPHDLQLVQASGTHSATEVKKFATTDGGPIPAWLHAAGGVGTVSPGKTGEATLRLEPGHYYAFCTEDTNGTSHAGAGMFTEFDVSGKSDAQLPAPTAHIEALEYKFTTSGLEAGDNLVEFTNSGKQLHMVLAVPLLPGKTIADVKQAFASNDQSAPPPVDFEKAVSTEVLDTGGTEYVHWNLAPGKYALLCFMSDRTGGAPHFMNGMLQELDVA